MHVVGCGCASPHAIRTFEIHGRWPRITHVRIADREYPEHGVVLDRCNPRHVIHTVGPVGDAIRPLDLLGALVHAASSACRGRSITTPRRTAWAVAGALRPRWPPGRPSTHPPNRMLLTVHVMASPPLHARRYFLGPRRPAKRSFRAVMPRRIMHVLVGPIPIPTSDFKKGNGPGVRYPGALDSARTAPGKAAVAPTPMPFQAPFPRSAPRGERSRRVPPPHLRERVPRGQRHRAPRLRRAARYPATRHECIAAAADRARTNGQPGRGRARGWTGRRPTSRAGHTSGASRPNVAPARVTGRPSRRSKLNTTSAAPVARTMAPRSLKDVSVSSPTMTRVAPRSSTRCAAGTVAAPASTMTGSPADRMLLKSCGTAVATSDRVEVGHIYFRHLGPIAVRPASAAASPAWSGDTSRLWTGS